MLKRRGSIWVRAGSALRVSSMRTASAIRRSMSTSHSSTSIHRLLFIKSPMLTLTVKSCTSHPQIRIVVQSSMVARMMMMFLTVLIASKVRNVSCTPIDLASFPIKVGVSTKVVSRAILSANITT